MTGEVIEGREVVEAVSVRSLVRRQLKLEPDPWELALVQRDLVWKEDGMAFLLDSLLARYPIGSLLLCQVRRGSTDARPQGTLQGSEYRVDAMTPQLVDGQQRSYALYSLFTGKGHGRFYVDLKAEWTREARYIEWRHGDAPADDDEGIVEASNSTLPDPTRFIDLGVLADLEQGRVLADALGPEPLTEGGFEAAVLSINPNFLIPTQADERAELVDKLNRILAAWHEERIPVVTAVVEGPEDILELFTRVNRGGAVVSRNDLYFAAVKTFWHDPDIANEEMVSAKAALDGIVLASDGYLNLWGALSLVSRLALAGLGEGDIVPLRVERLSRTNKDFIIRAIRTVAPMAAIRIAPFVQVLRANSELKQALRFTHPHLWEEVLAWAIASDREDTSWSRADAADVETYLLGGTLFGYAAKLRDPYRRDAMRVCLDAALRGERFPVESLLAVARHGSENLRRGRAEVLKSDQTQALARGSSAFIVAAAQGLDDDIKGLDWDHIVPDSWRGKLTLPRGQGRRFREEVKHINEPGNFWQIDLSANRIVQAAAPATKFADLERWDPLTVGRVSPSRFSGIEPTHRDAFEDLGRAMESATDEARKAEAAAHLAAVVTDRNAWLVTRLFELPIGDRARKFGADHAIEPTAPPVIPAVLSERLGLATVRQEFDASKLKARRTRPPSSNDVESILALEGIWIGRSERLESVLRAVTLKHAQISGDGVGNWIFKDPDAQTLRRSFPLRPLAAGDHLTLIATGRGTADGHPPYWAHFHRDSPNADGMWELLRADGSLTISAFAGETSIPIQVHPDMTWDETRQLVDDVITHIRSVVETESDVSEA